MNDVTPLRPSAPTPTKQMPPAPSRALWPAWVALSLIGPMSLLYTPDKGVERVGQLFSGIGNSTFIGVSLVFLLWWGWRHPERRAQWWWLDIILCNTLLVQALKVFTQLTRPSGSPSGFPSGHTSFAFALSWLVLQARPRLAPFWFAFALGIGWSRVEVQAHYPYQVFMGAVMGLLVAHTVARQEGGVLVPRLWTAPRERTLRVAGAGIALYFGCFFGLSGAGLFDLDEGYYGTVARGMVESGNWIVPRVGLDVFYDKPPLFYWCEALAMRLMGFIPTAARLPSAIATALTAMALWWWCKRMGRERMGWIAAALFLFCPLTFTLSHEAVLDALLTLFQTLAVMAILEADAVGEYGKPEAGQNRSALSLRGEPWRPEESTPGSSSVPNGPQSLDSSGRQGSPRNDRARLSPHALQENMRRRAYLLMALAVALAVMTKGVVGLLLPAVTLALLWSLRRDRAAWRGVPWGWMALVFVVVVAPWHIAMWRATGAEFVQEYIVHNHIERFLGRDFGHNAPPWAYVPVMLVGMFPWSLLAPLAWWRGWRARLAQEPFERALFGWAVWAATVLVFFSVSRSKLPSYVAPAVPALCVLVAARLDAAWASRGAIAKGEAWGVGLVGALLGALLLAVGALGWTWRGATVVTLAGHDVAAKTAVPIVLLAPATTLMGTLLVLGTAAMLWGWKRAASVVMGGVLMNALLTVVLAGIGLPIWNRHDIAPLHGLARRTLPDLDAGRQLVLYRLKPGRPSVRFVLGHPAQITNTNDETTLRKVVLNGRGTLILAPDTLPLPSLPIPVRVRETAPGWTLWECPPAMTSG